MCCLFGLYDYGQSLSARQKSRIISALAVAAEARGTDAAGIAYLSGSHLSIYKRPLPAHRLRFRIPAAANVVMGHTRMTTQGSSHRNYNNHPFYGQIGSMGFALAHNGVLRNDRSLQVQKKLPVSKIETDSYVIVQLLEQAGKLDLQTLKAISELLRGSFTYDTTYEFAVNHPKGLAIMLLMETGCSRSELLGLRFDDFDAEHGILHINQGLVSVNSKETGTALIADGLKNDYRHREIPILEPRLLARLKAEPRTITLGSGENEQTVDIEYIFHSPEGKAYIPRNWYEREYRPFMKALVKAHPEIPSLTPHELRHTRATLWSAQGVPQHLIADLLGHCDTRMLERVYNHTTTDTLRQALVAVQTKEGERA